MTTVWIAQDETGKLAAQRAFAAALASRGIPATAELAKTVLGKPYLRDYPGVQFNLSHSGRYGVCALSAFPVGVDVELIRPLRREVARRFFTPAEAAWLDARPEAEFFRLWTRKESYIKAIGKGLTQRLDSFSVLEELIFQGSTAWYFHEHPVEGGYLTLCAQEPDAAWVELG